MRRPAAIGALALVLVMSGCGVDAPLDDRIADREKCLATGGEWIEWQGGFGNVNHWCDLSTVDYEVGGRDV